MIGRVGHGAMYTDILTAVETTNLVTNTPMWITLIKLVRHHQVKVTIFVTIAQVVECRMLSIVELQMPV